ncbi:MAG TPA: serine hydrolase domain-containing protein, partial [Cytophagales bacterium]|nr:serine hydrolase domain-containing protein [Cytophagales bacterium]
MHTFFNMYLAKYGFCILVLTLAFPAPAQKRKSKPGHDRIESLMQQYHVPAVGIAVVKKGRLKEVQVYGALQQGVPASLDAVFNVASLTKPVVAMLTLKLVDMGQWDLDTPLSSYWVDPDVADDPR